MPSFVTKPGDLVFVRGLRWLDHPIILVTQSRYTHVAGFVSANQIIEAQSFRKTGYQSPAFYAGQADVYRCLGSTARHRCAVLAFVWGAIGSRYDYPLLAWEFMRLVAGVVLPRYKNTRCICSTLWADAYRAAGIDLCPGIRHPTPGELAKSPLLHHVASY